jgi:hypothetical protein
MVFFLLLPLDLIHWMKSSGDLPGFKKSEPRITDENYWAFLKLKPVADNEGPGLVFSDFILLDHNHTLSVGTLGFNALLNPNLDPSHARWAGVVTNIHFVPYLFKRFPGSRWVPITPYRVEDGGSAVGIIPITSENRSVFLRWSKAHGYFHRLSIQAENMMNNGVEYRKATGELPKGYPLVAGDPFLESCFGEWVAQYHFESGYGPNVQAIQRAIQKGYPTANLFYKLGNFYLIEGRPLEAKRAYLMAAESIPNYTNVRDSLTYLENKYKPVIK